MKNYQKAIDLTEELIALEHKKIDLLKKLVIGLELKKIKADNPGRDRVYRLIYTLKGITHTIWFIDQCEMYNYEKKHRLNYAKKERNVYKLPESA